MSKSRFVFDKFAKFLEEGLVNYKDFSDEVVNILRSKKVFLIGFDGFDPSDNYYDVFKANQEVIDKYSNSVSIISLTRTKYSVNLDSIYSYL